MNLMKYFQNLKPLELAVLAIFTVFIVFPIPVPTQLAVYVDNVVGIVLMFLLVLYLFFYCSPVLGVVFVLVVYELLRRSALVVARVPIIAYVPSQAKKDVEMVMMNPPQMTTLEEEIVQQRAPADISAPIIYHQTSFRPVAENVGGASLI